MTERDRDALTTIRTEEDVSARAEWGTTGAMVIKQDVASPDIALVGALADIEDRLLSSVADAVASASCDPSPVDGWAPIFAVLCQPAIVGLTLPNWFDVSVQRTVHATARQPQRLFIENDFQPDDDSLHGQ